MTTTRGRRTSQRTIPVLSALGLIGALLAINVSAASAAPCLAKIGRTASSSNLQTIIDGATTGDTIVVKGDCLGNFQIPGAGSATTLTLKGGGSLNGNASGTTLTIAPGETVTIKDLFITNGTGTLDPNGNTYAGGILNEGTLTLTGSSAVSGNVVTPPLGISEGVGGGIYSLRGTLTLRGNAVVTSNVADAGGRIFGEGGTISLKGHATLSYNNARYSVGGGICVQHHSTVTVSAYAKVIGDSSATYWGGGIYNRQYRDTERLLDGEREHG